MGVDVPSIVTRLRVISEHQLAIINQAHYISLRWQESGFLTTQIGDRLRCCIGDLSGIIQELESGGKVPQICGFGAIGISMDSQSENHENEPDFDVFFKYLVKSEGLKFIEGESVQQSMLRADKFLENRKATLMALVENLQNNHFDNNFHTSGEKIMDKDNEKFDYTWLKDEITRLVEKHADRIHVFGAMAGDSTINQGLTSDADPLDYCMVIEDTLDLYGDKLYDDIEEAFKSHEEFLGKSSQKIEVESVK